MMRCVAAEGEREASNSHHLDLVARLPCRPVAVPHKHL
jgi:hypothetical protein